MTQLLSNRRLAWPMAILAAASPALAQVDWTSRDPVPAAGQPAITYDSARQRVVVYTNGETWEWDGTTWLRRTTPNEPRFDRLALTYDSTRQRTVVFDGSGSTETWEWDGTSWVQRFPAQSPPPSSDLSMMYDAARQQAVLVRPRQYYGYETWLWDGTQWSASTAATPRVQRIAYDSVRQRIVAIARSGFPEVPGTWEWDGTAWTDRAIAPPDVQAMTYDTNRQRILGLESDAFGAATKVWEFDGASWSQRASGTTPPPALVIPGIAYDEARQQAVVFGGERYAYVNIPSRDTWLWDGTAWSLWPKPMPSARREHAMVYDSTRQRVLLFGGRGESQQWNDLWEWEGSRWNELSTGVSPPARRAPALAYDRTRDRVVVFGGGSPGYASFDDTWEWDGVQWTQQTPTTRPPAGGHAMVYDETRGRSLLVTASAPHETWEWDGNAWTQLQPATALPAMNRPAIVYDSKRGLVVLFSGDVGLNNPETWEWDGSDWTGRAPAASPYPRRDHAMVYDRARDRTMLMGGYTFVYGLGAAGDTWEWDGTTWLQRTTPAPGQISRVEHAMAYDEARETVVLYGGLWDLTPYHTVSDTALSDTWEYGATQPAAFTPFGAGCAGTVGTPVLGSPIYERPWLGESFTAQLQNLPAGNATAVLFGGSRTQWGPVALPFDLTVLGMTGCALYTSGQLVLPVANIGGAATWTTPVPALPALLGQAYYNQGLIADPGANPLGATTSNAAMAVIGGK